MASVALVTSSMSPGWYTYDGMAGASAPTSRRCRRTVVTNGSNPPKIISLSAIFSMQIFSRFILYPFLVISFTFFSKYSKLFWEFTYVTSWFYSFFYCWRILKFDATVRRRRRCSSSNKQKQHHTVQAARWLVALQLVIGPIPKQLLPPPWAALPRNSYLVRPEAICAPAFIDPSKVARRARLV